MKKIAVLLGGIAYDAQHIILEGITECAREYGVNVCTFTCGGDIYASDEHSRGEFEIYTLPKFSHFDGVIIAKDTIQNVEVLKKVEKKLIESETTIICIGNKILDKPCYGVDNRGAMYNMTRHVIEKHYRLPIVYLSGPKENEESDQRREGFIQAAMEIDLKEGTDFFIYYGNYMPASGKECVEKFIDTQKRQPKVVICGNDFMASGVIEGLMKRGLKVPEDVVVTGFDNSFEAKNNIVRITSIEKPLFEMGYEACKALIENRGNIDSRTFLTKKIYSVSCGCEKDADDYVDELKNVLYRERIVNNRWVEVIGNMATDLIEADSLSELVEKMKKYVLKLRFTYFYLCFCQNDELIGRVEKVGYEYRIKKINNTSYTDRMYMALAYENGKFVQYDPFYAKEVLPDSCFNSDEAKSFVALPIHFKEHCMGYCIVGTDSIPTNTLQFGLWTMNIGNALENIRKQTLMKDMVEKLNDVWIYDALTGVYNRAGFYRYADDMKKKCKKNNLRLKMFFADIDSLKIVNDKYGHEEGDFYIRAVSSVLRELCTNEGILMRYGGDEFVMLLPISDYDISDILISQAKERLYQIKTQQKKPYMMDVSIGKYNINLNENRQWEELLDKADTDMYKMKKNKSK